MISSLQFLSLIGVSFFGTFGFIVMFWLAGIVRTNIVWFVSVLSLSVMNDETVVPNVDAVTEVPVANIINHRSSSVRSPIKLTGTLSIEPIVRPVMKIYSSSDRERTLSNIRVCQVDSIPTLVDSESFGSIIIERRYSPTAAPTSDIFGP